MAKEFINIAYGGHNDAKDGTIPTQNFVIDGRPEYGSGTPELKAADHFRGVEYGSPRNINLETDELLNNGQLGEGTIVGAVAIPAHSVKMGVEWRVDLPLMDGEGELVAGATAEVRLASDESVLGTIELDAKGSGYFVFEGDRVADYTDTTDAIELVFSGLPDSEGTTETFGCVELACETKLSLCMTVAVNYINNAIEHKCRPFC